MPVQRSQPPSVTLASRFRIPSDVLSRDLSGEMVLLHLNSGTYFSLDPIGTRVWQILQEGRPLPHVLTTLLEEFDVDEASCRADLVRLLSELCEHGLLEAVDSDHS